jgi:HEPN domain-containing protein
MEGRSMTFFRGPERHLDEKEYALAAFDVEQAVQLILMDFLGSRLGDFPKAHSLKVLFDGCSKLCPTLAKIYESSVTSVSNIEDAYIMARYFDKDYSEAEVRKMLQFYLDLVAELKKCE